MPKRLSINSVALASLIFTYLFFAEYLSPLRKVHIPYDLWGYHYPLTDYAFQSFKNLSFPLWDPSIYCGQPFVANVQAALFYPPTWILFATSALHGVLTYTALEAFVFAHIWLGFILFFCWLRGKNLSDLACLLGAGIFAYSGYAMLQLQHMGLICCYAFFPLGLMGIDEMAERKIWPGFLKIVVSSAGAFLAGYTPGWFVLAVYLGMYALFSGKLAVTLRTLLALLASLAVGAVQLLPTFEASSLMIKENRYGMGIHDPAFYISYLIPNFYDFGINRPVMTNFGREYLYLGVPALFGLAALIRYRCWRPIVPLLGAFGVCFVFLSNPFGAVGAVVGKIPLLSEVCRDWYFLSSVTASVAAMAAIGIDQFLEARGEKSSSKVWAIAGILCAALWVAYELFAWRPGKPTLPAGWWSGIDVIVTLIIFAICIFAVRSQTGKWQIAVAIALLCSAAVDYKAFGTSKRQNGSREPLGHDYSKNGFSAINQNAFQALIDHRGDRIVVDPSAPSPVELRHHALATPQGFDPFIAQRYLDLVKDLGAQFQSNREFIFDVGNKRAFETLGVRYLMTGGNGEDTARLKADPDFGEIGGDSYFHVFEYQKFKAPYGWAEPTQGSVKLLSRTPEIRRFQINSPANAGFVLKEQYFPGWTAYLDGRAIPIELWQGALQQVQVPAGDHSLEFRYESRMLRTGAWISVISISILIAMTLLSRLRA